MPRSAGYSEPETLRHIAKNAQIYKQCLYDLLQLELGNRVLVAACGPGIDIDEEMISLRTVATQLEEK